MPYVRLYIASPISGRLLALNLNGSVRADGIDAIDFFLCGPPAIHICMYVYGAVREQFNGTLSMYELERYCPLHGKERLSTIYIANAVASA